MLSYLFIIGEHCIMQSRPSVDVGSVHCLGINLVEQKTQQFHPLIQHCQMYARTQLNITWLHARPSALQFSRAGTFTGAHCWQKRRPTGVVSCVDVGAVFYQDAHSFQVSQRRSTEKPNKKKKNVAWFRILSLWIIFWFSHPAYLTIALITSSYCFAFTSWEG